MKKEHYIVGIILVVSIPIVFFLGWAGIVDLISYSEMQDSTLVVEGVIESMRIEGSGYWIEYIIQINGKEYVLNDLMQNPRTTYYKLNIGDFIQIFKSGRYEIIL